MKIYSIDFNSVIAASTWREFDDNITSKCLTRSPVAGADHKLKQHNTQLKTSIADYYYEASAMNYVTKIKVPTLIVHSKDDPIVSVDNLPLDTCLAN